MVPPFDIFKVDTGSMRWLEAAEDLERAKARVQVLAASAPGEYLIFNHQTGKRVSIKPVAKRIVFQIGDHEKELNARAELLRRFGHEVISVADNDAAKGALKGVARIDLFIVGHSAPEPIRNEMVDWLKTNYPKVKIVALNPSQNGQLAGADYNVVLNDVNEWMSLVTAVAS
jgi:hypothetical protein